MRIISVVPSQTELLHDLGLEEEVIAITKFCIHPDDWFRTKQRIGGTKDLNIDLIRFLQPDLILANKEENVKEQIETLASEYKVWTSDISNYHEALEMIREVGELTNRSTEAEEMVNSIQFSFEDAEFQDHVPAAYLIWKDPYMSVGRDTFIHSMMKLAGFQNIFADHIRYPEISIHELRARQCPYLLLSSEPYPFRQKHIDELQERLPDTKILLVDGEMFSWYGSRMLKAAPYFKKLNLSLTEK